MDKKKKCRISKTWQSFDVDDNVKHDIRGLYI